MASRRGGGKGNRSFWGGILTIILVLIVFGFMMVTGWLPAMGRQLGFTPSGSIESGLPEAGKPGARGKVGIHTPKGKQQFHFSIGDGSTPKQLPESAPKAPSQPAPKATPKTAPKQAPKSLPSGSYTRVQDPYGGDWDKALNDLKQVRVSQANTSGYDRLGEFGAWQPRRGGGTTRDTILQRDMTGVRLNRYHEVQSGTLGDPYTGTTIRFQRGRMTSARIQIDHVVALEDAWASGARNWPQSKRVRYANSPDVLLAVDGPANMAKGAGLDFRGLGQYGRGNMLAPDVWMPSNTRYRCAYMGKRVDIKKRWNLSMTSREKQQSRRVLEACKVGR